MVRRLILKDWYLNRWMILGSLPARPGCAGPRPHRQAQVAFCSASSCICMVIIGAGAQFAMVTTINERKEQTLAFVMSLPVSWREYTAAKILANLIIFLIPWLSLTAGALGVLCSFPARRTASIPFTAIMSVEMLITTCLIVVRGHHHRIPGMDHRGIICLQPRHQRLRLRVRPHCAAFPRRCGARASSGPRPPGQYCSRSSRSWLCCSVSPSSFSQGRQTSCEHPD